MNDFSHAVTFLVQSVIIMIPGLIAPGPVIAVTIERGTGSPHAGAFVMLGHTFVELPLVLCLFMGLGKFTGNTYVRFILALAGGVVLLYMAWKTFRFRNAKPASAGKIAGSAFRAGIFMTLANPFFIVWWATIGSALIIRSTELGIVVSILFYVLHFILSFIWLYFISSMSYKGHSVLGSMYRLVVSVLCSAILFVFGGYFLLTAFRINL